MNIEQNTVLKMKKPNIEISKKQKKEALIAFIMIIVAVGGTFGFLGILKLTLKTDNPLVVVTSGSMEPVIEEGDLLVIQGTNPADIEIGTIILYDSRGLWPPTQYVPDPIVHRVVSRYFNDTDDKWYFYTLGDNNNGNIERVLGYHLSEDQKYAVVYSPYPETPVLEIITWLKD